MNKQEFIERMKSLKNIFGNKNEYIEIDAVIELASELDKSQKPVVKQFVADWYEEHKDDFETNLFNTIGLVIRDFEDGDLSAFEEWIVDEHTAPFQTLVNMHQFGYEVAKEKKFVVKLIKTKQYLYRRDGDYTFITYLRPDDTPLLCHTRKELEEAGFGWVFECEGVEVKEVEE